MNAKAVDGRRLHSNEWELQDDEEFVDTTRSRVAQFMGECSSESPFEFHIGGTSGHGVIGIPAASTGDTNTIVPSIQFVDTDKDGGINVGDKIQDDLFATIKNADAATSMPKFDGVPFRYTGMSSKEMSSVKITCSQSHPLDVVVIVKDKGGEAIEASITHVRGSDKLQVDLIGGITSKTDLRVEHIGNRKQKLHHSWGDRNLKTLQRSPNSITLRKLATIDTSSTFNFVQVVVNDADGMDVPKTLIVVNDEKAGKFDNRKLQTGAFKVEHANIDGNGDIVFTFSSLDTFDSVGPVVKLDARIGIISECSENPIEIVDMSAMVSSSSEPALVVHGGWFRKAAREHDVQCDWEPVVIDAIVKDPQARFSLGRQGLPITTVVMNGPAGKEEDSRTLLRNDSIRLRNLLMAAPSPDELVISEEMMQGRKPQLLIRKNARKLAGGSHKQILVHGYCSLGVFPISHFTANRAISFSDPDSSNPTPQSWSIDVFARKIDKFADRENIDGCGIIAHSQGGLAALHLYRSYWSCLDNPSNSNRMIQSIGSPYQGSLIANAAAIGDVLGASCAYNYELTESGATAWLGSIPTWARQKVTYYTTSFEDKWWSYDYCHIVSDLLLDNPEDGAVEKGRAYLSGGNSAGNKEGQCHTTDMYFMAQYLDSNRNRDMESKGSY